MLFVLIVLLLVASVFVLLMKKNRESLCLLGMCCSLMVQFSGILIFIAKKGGYSRSIINFLFFSQALRNKLQYLFITLDALGYIIAVGRYLFPLFLLESALQYSMIGWIRRHPDIQKWICVLPAATLAVYFPPVFRFIANRWPVMHSVLVEGSYWWITAYVAVALVLMIQELFAITMRFCRKQFVGIVGCHLALSGLYLLYCGQDPAQVYQFYSYDYIWNKGIGYLQYAPTIAGYVTMWSSTSSAACSARSACCTTRRIRSSAIRRRWRWSASSTSRERARPCSSIPSKTSFWPTASSKSASRRSWTSRSPT